MKIVQINAVYESSSTGRTVKEMHESLIARGYESFVFCTNMEKLRENVFHIGSKTDYKIHAALSRFFGLQGYFSFFPTRRLIEHLRTIKPDVVILRNLHANYINFPMLLNYLGTADIAVINVLHDCWSFTGHCCHYTEDACDKWKTECNKCPILHKYNKSLFFDNSTMIFRMKQSAFATIRRLAIVGVSNWTAMQGKQSPIFSSANIVKCIYNWISLDVFYPKDSVNLRNELRLRKDDFVVLGVSQKWSDVKGLNHFLCIANQLKDVIFVMIGNMPDGLILLPNIISVAPLSSPNKLAEYYSMADVFLNFSLQETFGKVSAEALACGTPLIVNNSTANPELCGNRCGFVIENNDHSKIIDAIDTIRKEGKIAYTERCRAFAEANFDKEKGIDNYVALFQELTNG